MSKSHPIHLSGYVEQEALTGWRKFTNWRPGQRKAAKNTYNRRMRRSRIERREDA